jgi:Presenilin enhancer-2 subunit of gamma secretase
MLKELSNRACVCTLNLIIVRVLIFNVQYIYLYCRLSSVFMVGCLGLPFLWIVNLFYFRRSIFSSEGSSSKLSFWLRLSLTGSVLSVLIIATWVIYFQLTWQTWDKDYFVYQAPQSKNDTNSTVAHYKDSL